MSDGFKADPKARMFALVPVVLIVGGLIAAMLGIRPEGRTHAPPEWRTHTVEKQAFAVATPGVFIVNQQMMNFDGKDVPAQVYIAYDLGVDYSVSAVRRPDDDVRPFDEVAISMGLSGRDIEQRNDGLPAFRHDVTLEGTRTQALLIFKDRMMYQLMVTTPAGSVSSAQRFFDSFRLLGNS